MNLDKPQIPDSMTRKETINRAHVKNADVKWTTASETLHSNGSHVSVKGPSSVSGHGKAGEVAKVLGHVKTVAKKFNQ